MASMLAQRFGDTPGRGEGGAAEQHHGIVQVLQALQQKAVMGGAVDCSWKSVFSRA